MSGATAYSHAFELPVGPDAAFELFADPERLDALTPRWFRLRPLTTPPPELEAGLEIPYRLRWRGVSLPWTSLLTEWRRPGFFAYEQKRGPFRRFRHEHSFHPVPGGTRVVDRVLFRAPGGRLADRWVAGPDLRRIFEYRELRAREMISEAASSPEPARNAGVKAS